MSETVKDAVVKDEVIEKSDEKKSLLTRLEEEGEIAADYLEALLDIADLDGDIDMDVENGRAAVAIAGGNLGTLVGRNGEVLDALQELTRLAVQTVTDERSRLMLDIQKKYNTASLIISHDVNCVKIVANRIVVLIDGISYAEGTYQELIQSTDSKVKQFFD